jgi:hypothetical protein
MREPALVLSRLLNRLSWFESTRASPSGQKLAFSYIPRSTTVRESHPQPAALHNAMERLKESVLRREGGQPIMALSLITIAFQRFFLSGTAGS